MDAPLRCPGCHELRLAFLGDTLLSADFIGTPEARARLCNVIDERAAQFRREFAADPHLRANLLDALGRARARVLGLADAERLLFEARDVRSAAFGEQSLEYAQSLSSLGAFWYGNGRLAEAAAALRACYELHRTCPVDVHTDVARAANDLAAAERALGNAVRAHELHEEALALRRRDGETAAVAESLNNLANSEPDPAKAAAYLADAWRIRKAVLGADDPLTIQTAINAGSQALQQGETAKALPVLRDAVAAARALGERGVELLPAGLRSLAYAELRSGDVDAALRAATEALQLGRPGTPLRASALEVAAMIHEQRGAWDDAAASWREALAIRKATLPAGHRTIERTQASLDAVLLESGRPAR